MTILFGNGNIAKRRYPCLILTLLCFVFTSFRPVSARMLELPVAKVNGTVLTEADLSQAFNEIMPAGVFHGGFSSEKRKKYRPQALERMIEKELLYQEAVKRRLKIDNGLIEKERGRTIRRLGGKKKYNFALKKMAITDKQYRAKLRKKHLAKRIITLEVEDKAKMPDKAVTEYYERNTNKFMRPEARRITHILISVKPSATFQERKVKRERAQAVVDKIKAGEDMAGLARGYSDDPYRVKGGDFGLVHKGRLNAELEKEVFNLETGRLSGIIETIYGYHIVRVEEVRAPEQLSLEEVAEKIKKELTEQKEKRLRKSLIAELRKKARIEIY